jgi:hypothetical protein
LDPSLCRSCNIAFQTLSLTSPKRPSQSRVRSSIPNPKSHELWRETAKESRKAPWRPEESGAFCPIACDYRAFGGRAHPERQFAYGLMAEHWKPKSNVLCFLPSLPIGHLTRPALSLAMSAKPLRGRDSRSSSPMALACYRPSIFRSSSVVFTSAKTRFIVFSSPSWVSRETSATASLTRMVR